MKNPCMTILMIAGVLGVLGAGCSAEDPAPEEIGQQSQAVIDCNINCYQDAYPTSGTGWYLTATDYCPTPTPRIYCKWSRFPGFPTTTFVVVPSNCPNCTNDTSHICNGTCGQNDLASTWTCAASC